MAFMCCKYINTLLWDRACFHYAGSCGTQELLPTGEVLSEMSPGDYHLPFLHGFAKLSRRRGAPTALLGGLEEEPLFLSFFSIRREEKLFCCIFFCCEDLAFHSSFPTLWAAFAENMARPRNIHLMRGSPSPHFPACSKHVSCGVLLSVHCLQEPTVSLVACTFWVHCIPPLPAFAAKASKGFLTLASFSYPGHFHRP